MAIGKDLAIATAVGAAAYTGGASLGLIGGTDALGAAIAAAPVGTEVATAGESAALASGGLTGFQELSLGSSLLSGLGSLASGKAAQKSAEYNAAIAGNNAQIASQNATAAIQEGEANAAAASMASKAKIGGILANQGASGVDVNSGSSVDTRSSAAENGELNAINIRSQAARSAYGYETSGTSATAEKNMYESQADYSPIQGAIGAGTSLLSGVASVNSPWASFASNGGLGN